MKILWKLSFIILVIALLPGCETPEAAQKRDAANALRQFQFEGLKIGDPITALKKFPNVQEVPAAIVRNPRKRVFEIYQPNEFVSLAVGYFTNDRLYKLELRYFDGPSAHSLSKAGGWVYLRDYMINRFGPPTQSGSKAQVATDQPGLNPAFAKANLQWYYPQVNRRLNYIAMYDKGQGVAIVTLVDSKAVTELGQPPRIGTLRAQGQPGF